MRPRFILTLILLTALLPTAIILWLTGPATTRIYAKMGKEDYIRARGGLFGENSTE